MQALVKTQAGRGFLELLEVEDPKPSKDEVLIEIKAAGICGSDLHFYEGTLTHCCPPVILGHEFAGQIVETGANVRKYRVGDHVVSEPHKGGCGSCRHCLTGHVEICGEKRAIGYKIDGSFTKYIAMPWTSLHAIPSTLPYDEAALAEPIAVVVKGVLERTRVEPEDFVVVLGCGPIGILAGAIAKVEGARYVVVTGTDQDEKTRLKVARRMRFIDAALNIDKEDLSELVQNHTKSIGADLVVEASGAEKAIQQAFEILRIDGRISVLGHTGKETLSVPWETGLHKSGNVNWSFSSTWTSWERAVSILSTKNLDAGSIITHRMPLKDWKNAFELIKNLDAIKVILTP